VCGRNCDLLLWILLYVSITWSGLWLFCLVLSCLVLSCLVSSYPVPSYPILSYLVLSYPVLSCRPRQSVMSIGLILFPTPILEKKDKPGNVRYSCEVYVDVINPVTIPTTSISSLAPSISLLWSHPLCLPFP